jgi:drug/metabolite transporter (DMT)-like permease
MKTGSGLSVQGRAELYALSAVLLWSTVASAFKIALRSLTYEELLFYSLPASIISLAFIITARGKWREVFIPRSIYKSLLFGLVNPFIYYLVIFKAYALLPAQQAQPLNNIWAVILTILSAAVLKQKFRIRDFISVLISFSGAFLIISGGNLSGFSDVSTEGVLFAIASAFIWAAYWLMIKIDSRDGSSDTSVRLFGCFLSGFLYITVYMFFKGSFNHHSAAEIIPALYVGIFEMGITFYLWSRAVHLALNTARISNLIYLTPYLSFIFISLILGETIKAASAAGLILITAGIIYGRSGK